MPNLKNSFLLSLTILFLSIPITSYAKKPLRDTSFKNAQTTSKFYESMFDGKKQNKALLHLFFNTMPKGGDLHHHYSGSLYAETYLEWVAQKGWLIDTCTLTIVKRSQKNECELLSVKDLMGKPKLYRKLLSLWSDKDYGKYIHRQPPPDSNFFNTFFYFEPISHAYISLGLEILKKRAIYENLSYIETMLSRVGVRSSNYFDANSSKTYNQRLRAATSQEEVDSLLDKIVNRYSHDKRFSTSIEHYVNELQKSHNAIDDANFTMRYQTYAVRVLNPLQVFTDLFSGYEAALKSSLIVGVNIVAPENNAVALSDYTLHMRMYNYLARRSPSVHRALHAGELTLGMVRPKNLTFHIQHARDIAKAQRIGHGVDLSYEEHPLKLLEDLKKNAAIEINFTSNEFILGVKDEHHPYLIYATYGVPLIISTDDSGVSRNNLTNEYLLLATRYHPSYERIKAYVYNSIKYAFLETSKKEQLVRDLDKRFMVFEKKMAALSKTLGAVE